SGVDRVVACVRDVEERGLALPLFLAEQQTRRVDSVAHLLSGDHGLVLGLSDLLLEVRWRWGLRGRGGLLSRLLLLLCFLGRRRRLLGHRCSFVEFSRVTLVAVRASKREVAPERGRRG